MGYINLPRINKRIQQGLDIVYPEMPLPNNSVGKEHLKGSLKAKILTATVDDTAGEMTLRTLSEEL